MWYNRCTGINVALIGFYKSKKGRSRRVLFSILLLSLSLLALAQKTAKSNNDGEKLQEILIGTAQYCERLKQAVFHFLCFETIEENIKKTTSVSLPKPNCWSLTMAVHWKRTAIPYGSPATPNGSPK
jgi:hypothetical protein